MNYRFTQIYTKIKNIFSSFAPAKSSTFAANIISSNAANKYLLEFSCIIIPVILISIFTADKPAINYSAEIEKLELSQTEENKDMIQNVSYNKFDYKNIETRNIFSQDGSYGLIGKMAKAPDISYQLLGVFVSNQKRAALMKYTNKVKDPPTITAKVGDRLNGGFVVTDINSLSVKLKKGGEEIELKIFELEKELDEHKR